MRSARSPRPGTRRRSRPPPQNHPVLAGGYQGVPRPGNHQTPRPAPPRHRPPLPAARSHAPPAALPRCGGKARCVNNQDPADHITNPDRWPSGRAMGPTPQSESAGPDTGADTLANRPSRPHGSEPALSADLKALVDDLDLTDTVLAGFSMGTGEVTRQ